MNNRPKSMTTMVHLHFQWDIIKYICVLNLYSQHKTLKTQNISFKFNFVHSV